ncbi:cysteine dioxygenase [Argonema antarcticum]|uniref:cysteine dioxygenase n=1 Tax=Argonema antarcticum TaxID=2942763 RepID=UPI00201233FC|nr:cysteine dioxygenase family protein [Argonema antarcticum]MCL1474112.1 cysteine dioxygenase family protein [Argonema antarcticum A004/B2]
MSVNLLTKRLTLDDFILEMMRIAPQDLNLEQLQDLVAQLDLNDTLLRQHITFSDKTYARKLLCRTSRFDMLVLSWHPGQFTTIHDHAGALNVTRVRSGTLTARLFEVYDKRSSTEQLVRVESQEQLVRGELASVDRDRIHQLANTSDEKLVTLHVYAHPLSSINVYCPNSGQVDRVALQYTLEQ